MWADAYPLRSPDQAYAVAVLLPGWWSSVLDPITVLTPAFALLKGKSAMVHHFQNSSLLMEDERLPAHRLYHRWHRRFPFTESARSCIRK